MSKRKIDEAKSSDFIQAYPSDSKKSTSISCLMEFLLPTEIHCIIFAKVGRSKDLQCVCRFFERISNLVIIPTDDDLLWTVKNNNVASCVKILSYDVESVPTMFSNQAFDFAVKTRNVMMLKVLLPRTITNIDSIRELWSQYYSYPTSNLKETIDLFVEKHMVSCVKKCRLKLINYALWTQNLPLLKIIRSHLNHDNDMIWKYDGCTCYFELHKLTLPIVKYYFSELNIEWRFFGTARISNFCEFLSQKSPEISELADFIILNYNKIFTESATIYHTFIRECCKNNASDQIRSLLLNEHIDCDPIIYYAAECGSDEILKIVLQDESISKAFYLTRSGAHPAYDNNRAIHGAVQNNQYSCVQILYEQKSVQSTITDSLIHNALKKTNLDSFKYLYSRIFTPDVTKSNNELLLYAFNRLNTEAASFLLQDPRTDPTIDNHHCFRQCLMKPELLKILLENPKIDHSIRTHYLDLMLKAMGREEENSQNCVQILESYGSGRRK